MGSSERMIMNIWQPNWTDENSVTLQPNDTKFLRMKYFILDLGRVHRKFVASNGIWDQSDSSLVYEGIEFKFRFTFNRDMIDKYMPKGIRCAYATAIKNNEDMTTIISFTQKKNIISTPETETQEYKDPSIVSRMIIESTDTDLIITVRPSYYIWQIDGVKVPPVSLRGVEIEASLPSIILWYPDFPEIKNVSDIFSKMKDETTITFSIFDKKGTQYTNQKGYVTLPVYNVASTGQAWNDLYITVSGSPWTPRLYITATETDDYTNWTWRYVGDPKTWITHTKELPVPLPVNSRSHRNHTWTANGIKYISSQPSSEVAVETKKKSSPWIISLFNKLIKKDKKYE